MQHIGHYMGSHLSEEWQTLKLTLASLDTVIFSTAVLSVCVCVQGMWFSVAAKGLHTSTQWSSTVHMLC